MLFFIFIESFHLEFLLKDASIELIVGNVEHKVPVAIEGVEVVVGCQCNSNLVSF